MVRFANVFGVTFVFICLLFQLSGCSKNLSEGKAEALIKDYLDKNPQQKTFIIEDHAFPFFKEDKHPDFPAYYRTNYDEERYIYDEMQNKGLLKWSYEPVEYIDNTQLWQNQQRYNISDVYGWQIRRVTLSETGQKYIIKNDNGLLRFATSTGQSLPRNIINSLDEQKKNGKKYEVLGAAKKFVRITGIKEPSDAMGQLVCEVEYETKWEITPFGEVFLKNNSEPTASSETALFVRYQDGWRLEK